MSLKALQILRLGLLGDDLGVREEAELPCVSTIILTSKDLVLFFKHSTLSLD